MPLFLSLKWNVKHENLIHFEFLNSVHNLQHCWQRARYVHCYL